MANSFIFYLLVIVDVDIFSIIMVKPSNGLFARKTIHLIFWTGGSIYCSHHQRPVAHHGRNPAQPPVSLQVVHATNPSQPTAFPCIFMRQIILSPAAARMVGGVVYL